MDRNDAARKTGANAAVAGRVLPEELVDRRVPVVGVRPLNIDRRMK
jgi:hypothetical protein